MFSNKQQVTELLRKIFACFKKLKFCLKTLQEGLYMYLRPSITFAWMSIFQILATKISMETKSAKTSYCGFTKQKFTWKILGELCTRMA